MIGNLAHRSQAASRVVLFTLLCFASLFLPARASAKLGGDESSVAADQQDMKAKRAVQTKGKYAVHEITTPYGTVIREYVAQNGTVFGVAWRGPFLPNFKQILGDSYGAYEQGARESRGAQARRSRNLPLSVERPELVVRSAGHTRAYAGQAYIPALIPQGVDAREIR